MSQIKLQVVRTFSFREREPLIDWAIEEPSCTEGTRISYDWKKTGRCPEHLNSSARAGGHAHELICREIRQKSCHLNKANVRLHVALDDLGMCGVANKVFGASNTQR